MDNDYKDLRPIRHKEFNKIIKGKGFKGRNNYKLKDLKAMFGLKPMITGSPVTISSDELQPTRFDSISKASVTISSDELQPTRFDSISKASAFTGIPYVTLLYAKKNSKRSS